MAHSNQPSKELTVDSLKEALAELAKVKDGGSIILEGRIPFLEIVPGNPWESLAKGCK